MNILLAGHIAVARGSRISKVGQQRLQRFKRRQVGSALSEDHRGAGIQAGTTVTIPGDASMGTCSTPPRISLWNRRSVRPCRACQR